MGLQSRGKGDTALLYRDNALKKIKPSSPKDVINYVNILPDNAQLHKAASLLSVGPTAFQCLKGIS